MYKRQGFPAASIANVTFWHFCSLWNLYKKSKQKNRNQRFVFCELVNANESSISNYPVRHVCRIAAGSARLHIIIDNRECKTPQKLTQATLIRLQDSGCHNRECKTIPRHFCTISALQTWHFGTFSLWNLYKASIQKREIRGLFYILWTCECQEIHYFELSM